MDRSSDRFDRRQFLNSSRSKMTLSISKNIFSFLMRGNPQSKERCILIDL